MPTNSINPGVNIREVPDDTHTIPWINTSIVLILGRTAEGPLNTPIRCTSYNDFERTFSSDHSLSQVSRQVKLFFINGGSICYVMRLKNSARMTGNDVVGPTRADYNAAYLIADEEIDLFNLMLLPRDANPAQPLQDLYGAASVFCQRRRAFLLMEGPQNWTDAQIASNNVDDLRLGLVNDHAAVFYPNVTISDGEQDIHISPVGAIAGVIARTDSARGVWKAPAGVEASLHGVNGLEHQFLDRDSGVLNPRAINTLRVFSRGIFNWGARTMDGDDSFASEYKYIPVRRLALHIEESLFRGLKWVVFEPNNERLWAKIRSSVGVFMQNLFLQGAFQGSTASDAYFVMCNSETTTQADRDLGIVNIAIGFAPLKPAEFVVLSLQQIAGQLEDA